MHELVWRLFEQAGPQASLAPLAGDPDCDTLACFAGRGGADLLWLAKIAHNSAAARRLAREHAALEYLAPWQAPLRAPRCLGWRRGERQACLVQSGLPGRIPSRSRHGGAVGGAVADWIERLQRTVPAPRTVTVQELAAEWIERPGAERESWAPAELSAALAAAASATAPLPAVATHGDLWFGNVLWRDGLSGVADWCGFAAGGALDDWLLFLVKSLVPSGRRARLFRALFFESGSPARAARETAARLAPPAAWRLAFYFFLARRIWWEAGYSYQPRSQAEREASRREWQGCLAWLAEHDFPAPWAGLA